MDGSCSGCDKLQAEGLVFTKLADGTYSVSMGSATDENVVIPSVYQGVQVTAIANFGFRDSNITSITIPESVTSIGNYAFNKCTDLTDVTIGNGVTTIGEYAFLECSSLKSIIIPNSMTSIKNYAFLGCSGLTSVTIPDSVTSIDHYAFFCSGLTSIVIPDSVTSIGAAVFAQCSDLTNIIIGNSVTSIGRGVFTYCSKLKSIYYKGTAENWDSISIDSDNKYLTDATRYYYSESEPEADGNYWRYDENGEIVVCKKETV